MFCFILIRCAKGKSISFPDGGLYRWWHLWWNDRSWDFPILSQAPHYTYTRISTLVSCRRFGLLSPLTLFLSHLLQGAKHLPTSSYQMPHTSHTSPFSAFKYQLKDTFSVRPSTWSISALLHTYNLSFMFIAFIYLSSFYAYFFLFLIFFFTLGSE